MGLVGPGKPRRSYVCSKRSQMWDASIIRRCISTAALACLVLSAITDGVRAQASRVMTIEDQPGHVPDPSVERLPAAFQRQAVFYRTSEAPGTIIVDTADRYLYLIHG